MTVPVAAACQNHPERNAIGVCVECRARVCGECVTKVDGINYCVSCLAVLAERGARARKAERRPTSPWVARALASLLIGAATLLTWVLLEVALPGGG